jgi:hypothetical protein
MAKKKVRIRSKRLDQLDESKLALAVWLIARDLVTDKTTPPDKQGEPGELEELDEETA